MEPTPGDVHVNTPLTNISVAFHQSAENFVAGRVFPEVPVQKQSDRYYTYDRGYFNRDDMKRRAPGTESAGGGYSVDNTPTYFCDVWGFHHDVPDQVRANEDSPIKSDRDATILCSTKHLIRREKIWVSKYFTTGVWTYEITGTASSTGANVIQWNDAASDPIVDVRNAATSVAESTGFRPNTLVLGRRVYDKLCDHPDFMDRIKYGGTNGEPARVNRQALSALFEIDSVFVMDAIENTAKEGQTNSHSFIGGKHALLVYSAPSPGLQIPTGGYTFTWSGLYGMQKGIRMKSFRMEALESDRIEIGAAFDCKLVAADLGYFFNAIVA